MPATIAAIAAHARAAARRFDIDVLDSCDSTNAVLLARAEAGAPSGTVVIANEQTAGRGRRGRSWFASPGDSLTFSLLWRFAPGTAPAGLSLAVGLAVAQALTDLCAGVGAGDTALKWPNDILKDGRKLGGILVELLPGAPHAAVIGIGINLHLPPKCPMTCVPPRPRSTCRMPDENALYASLLTELLAPGAVRRRRLRPAARGVAGAPRLSGCRWCSRRFRRAARRHLPRCRQRRRAAVRKRRPRRARALRRSFAAPGLRPRVLLCLDAGNTRLKFGLFDGGRVALQDALDYAAFDGLPARLPAKPTRIVACNVAGEPVRQRIEALAGTARASPGLAKSSAAACGVSNGYDTPQQLGADRWAALIGARALHGGACVVVVAGTATTIDALDDPAAFAAA
jgi:biotin-[acetyl-CoA-carboxylase] ligase BirA-like protein